MTTNPSTEASRALAHRRSHRCIPGVIGNCAISALVDSQGDYRLSVRRVFDGDPVFNALLQPGDAGDQ